jgi:hypothetical protein
MERYNQFIEACRISLGVVLGDLVDVSACTCACAGDLVDVVGCVCLLMLAKFGESFHVYTRFIRWDGSNSTVY